MKKKEPASGKPAASRDGNRRPDELRPVKIRLDVFEFAHGSASIEIGRTKVAAAATVEERVPPFLKGRGKGWVTAEYAMLPCATESRTPRERGPGRISGRSMEIQRLLGRALRTAVDLSAIGERQIIVDCDVLQADGGTRTASVTVGCIALALALKKMMDARLIDRMPLRHLVAGISVGLVDGQPFLDLDYDEDFRAGLDMNVIETDDGQLVEVQAGAEKMPFSRKELAGLLKLADKGIARLVQAQKNALKKKSLMFMAYGRRKERE
jgi:ribonuclease PH